MECPRSVGDSKDYLINCQNEKIQPGGVCSKWNSLKTSWIEKTNIERVPLVV